MERTVPRHMGLNDGIISSPSAKIPTTTAWRVETIAQDWNSLKENGQDGSAP